MHLKSVLLIGGLTLLTAATGCQHETVAMNENANQAGAGDLVLTTAASKKYGRYLADRNGRALYLLEDEPKGESTCHGECAEQWPPMKAPQGSLPTTGPGVQQNLIGTIERDDGTRQVTYNGHALYYYKKDGRTGRISGQDYTDQWGEWYLLTPAGKVLEEEEHEESEHEANKHHSHDES